MENRIEDDYEEECYILSGITLNGEYHCFANEHTILTPDYDLIIGADQGKDSILWSLEPDDEVILEVNGVALPSMSVSEAMVVKLTGAYG